MPKLPLLDREGGVLKLDIDRKRPPSIRQMEHRLNRAGYELLAVARRHSPGGKGWHVWVEVSPSPTHPLEVVALQAILGSDPLREAVTLARALVLGRTPPYAREWWNVLYAPDKARSRRCSPPLSRGKRKR